MNKKIFFRGLKIFLLLYCLIGIGIYYLQDKIFFHPLSVPESRAYHFEQPFRELNIPYNRSANINIVQFYDSTAVNRGVILYFHGNKNNIEWYAHKAAFLTGEGYEVWMIDYPGYGKSSGDFSETALYEWSDQLYKLARARFAADSIVIYGQSLGSGIAAWLAAHHSNRALIMEAAYYSFPSLLSNYLPIFPAQKMIHFKIPTWQYLQQVEAPVLILHGSSDWTIPLRNAEKLKPFLKKTDTFRVIPGAGHNDIPSTAEYKQSVHQFLESLQTKPGN